MEYTGSCHCGAITYKFIGAQIEDGLRCNCSLCQRKGAVMTRYAISPEDIQISDPNQQLTSYQFADKIAKHYFCKTCGIYTFHQTRSQPGMYRINLGCITELNSATIPYQIFNGADV